MKNIVTIILVLIFSGKILSQDIEVISPNGGELFGISTLQEIKWTSSGVTNVKIELTMNSDTSWSTILESISASAGSYYWMVPNINSKFCKIKVSDAGNPLIFDKSNGFFSIKKLSETEPNNTAAEANVMDIKDSLDASINPVGDIDYFKFYGNTGDTLEIILANRNNSELYAPVQLFHESGDEMSSNYFYYYDSPLRIPFVVPYAGNYFIRLAYDYGNYPNKVKAETGDYRITLKKIAAALPQITYFGYYDTYYNSTRLQIGLYSNILNTQIRLEYGLTDSYGSTLAAPDTVNDVYESYISVKLGALSSNSTYHVRVIAENDSGTVYSEDYTFATPEAPHDWTLIRIDTLTNNLRDVAFYDENNGYAIEEYDILKTTDGGNTWRRIDINQYLIKIINIDANNTIALSSWETIIKTTNGGANWEIIDTDAEENVQDLYFTDVNNGIIVGYNGSIIKTTNGGLDWTPVTSGTTERLYSVCFSDINNGWASGYNGTILNTTDGGATWTPQVSGTSSDIYDVSFVTSQLGLAATEWDSEILVTVNGGATWTTQALPGDSYYPQISFVDMNNIVYVNRDGIYHSNDAGATWNPQKIGTTNQLYGVSKMGNRWIVVGDYGTIIKSSFGEVAVRDENVLPDEFSLKQNYPNPFNPGTKISYSIPRLSFVSLKVYDILGKEAAALVNEEQIPGRYEVTFNASDLSAGIYFYTLQAGSFTATKKMILLK